MNLAVTDAEAAGFSTVYPCGSQRPNAASINFRAGQTLSNNVVAAIGDDGRVCIYTWSTTHVVIDVTGWIAAT